MLFIYLAVLCTAGYWVIKTLGPEMAKPPSPKKVQEEPDAINFSQYNWPSKKIEKLETILAEKNTNISLLQKELKISQAQVQAHDKVKALLDDEIHRLREQNRVFRSELGLPTDQPKVTLII